jgi:hypothetical protein
MNSGLEAVGAAWFRCPSVVQASGGPASGRLHPSQRCGMFGHFLAIHDRFAACCDSVSVVKGDSQCVHVRFLRGIDPAPRIEVEGECFGISRFEQHGRPVAHGAIMGQSQLATAIEVHRDHLVRRALEYPLLENAAASEQTVPNGNVHRTLPHVGFARPGTNESFHPLELRR